MEAMECIVTRRSCRAFSPDMPPRELIARVCEAGTYAPTGHNTQSPLIVAVTDRATRDRLSRLNARIMSQLSPGHELSADFDPFYGAPVVLVVLANADAATHFEDGCAVVATLLNAAHACGLGSCWIHRARQEFDSPEGQAMLREWGIEGHYVGIDHVVLGYEAKHPRGAAPRKPDYVRWVE